MTGADDLQGPMTVAGNNKNDRLNKNSNHAKHTLQLFWGR